MTAGKEGGEGGKEVIDSTYHYLHSYKQSHTQDIVSSLPSCRRPSKNGCSAGAMAESRKACTSPGVRKERMDFNASRRAGREESMMMAPSAAASACAGAEAWPSSSPPAAPPPSSAIVGVSLVLLMPWLPPPPPPPPPVQLQPVVVALSIR